MYQTKEYTVDDFNTPVIDGKPIEESSQNGSTLNYSSILTRLIQEAGRWCKRYASDLFIDWYYLINDIKNNAVEDRTLLFGFREDGVDGNRFVCSRYTQDRTLARYEYRALWRLDITVDDDLYIHMKLQEVQR